MSVPRIAHSRPPTDTTGRKPLNHLATPGWRVSVRSYVRQYEPHPNGDPPRQRGASTLYILVLLLVALLATGVVLGVLFQLGAEDPGEFTITEVEPGNTSINENATIAVSATVENTGDTPTTEVVSIALGDAEERTSIHLGPGERETIELTDIPANQFDLGMTTYEIATEDDEHTGELDIQSDRPPVFEVSDLRPQNVSIESDHREDVSAEIMNTGGATANQTVELRFDGEPFTNTTMELEPEESETYTVYNVPFAAHDPGEQEYGVFTANDSETVTIEVPEPAAFEFSEFEPGHVTLEDDESLTTGVTIENTGNLTDRRTIELTVGNETVANETVELAPGDETSVEFVDIEIDAAVGTETYELSTAGAVETGTLIFEGDEPGELEITEFEPGDTTLNESLFNASATVENTGEQTVEETITFELDGEERTSTDVEVPPGETEEIRLFNIYVGGLDADEVEYGFVTGDDSVTATLEL